MEYKSLIHVIHYFDNDEQFVLKVICFNSDQLLSIINSLINRGCRIDFIQTVYE